MAAERLANLLTEPLQRLGILSFPAPMQNAAFRFILLALDKLPAGHLFLFDLLDHRAGNLLAQLSPGFRRAGVGQERGDERRPASGQRSAGRPDMQGRDVPMAHVFLVDAVKRCLLERKGEFDQSRLVSHRGFFFRKESNCFCSCQTTSAVFTCSRRMSRARLLYRLYTTDPMRTSR